MSSGPSFGRGGAAAATLGLGMVSCDSWGEEWYKEGGGTGNSVAPSSGGSTDPAPTTSTTPSTTPATTRVVNPSALELAVITEMNFARTEPQRYVTERLVPQRTNPTFKNFDSTTFDTYLEECIAQMNAMTPLTPLTFGAGLYKAAQDWVAIQGQGTTNQVPDVGHFSADGRSTPGTRASVYCNYTAEGENISYGCTTAEDIVASLLVDDNFQTRGHRYNILEMNGYHHYTYTGATIGSHGYYRTMCVIEYADGYSEK